MVRFGTWNFPSCFSSAAHRESAGEGVGLPDNAVLQPGIEAEAAPSQLNNRVVTLQEKVSRACVPAYLLGHSYCIGRLLDVLGALQRWFTVVCRRERVDM